MEADATRTKLQLDEQRVRNFNDEIRAAKTDEEVAFIQKKVWNDRDKSRLLLL